MDRIHKRIYVFEREPRFQMMLEAAWMSGEVLVNGFSGACDCVTKVNTKPCDLLVLDLGGCESEGLDVLRQVKRVAPWTVNLAIVEHAAVASAVRAVRAGASDCLDRPVAQEQLLATVRLQLARIDTSVRRRMRALTAIELHILGFILDGRTSCSIAAELHRSKRTVDAHRTHIMHKLQAANLAELVKRAFAMGFYG